MIVHTYPTNDLLEHTIDDWSDENNCACLPVVKPIETDEGVINWQIVHNAWDGRK